MQANDDIRVPMKRFNTAFGGEIPHADDMIRAACKHNFVVFANSHSSVAFGFINTLKNN